MEYELDYGWQEDLEQAPPVTTDIRDRFKHTYVIGRTGAGKSTLVERMIYQDMCQGISTIFIDPKGDSAKRLYELAPDKSKVRYVSVKKPIIINPLKREGLDVEEIASEFVQIMDILITLTTSNPQSTVYMREIIGKALRTLKMEERNMGTFIKFLSFKKERSDIYKKLPEGDLKAYWYDFDAMDNNMPRNKDKQETAKRVASRLEEIQSGKIKDFINGENSLFIDQMVENGETLLVDTSRMTFTNRAYLTNLIVYAVGSYGSFHNKFDKPLMVYVDEFQLVVSKHFADLIGLLRHHKIGFTLIHHNFSEIPENILDSVIGIVGNFIIFRTGDKEAKRFSDILGVPFRDIMDMDDYYAWLRLINKNVFISTDKPLLEEVPDLSYLDPAEKTAEEILEDLFIFEHKYNVL